MPRRTATPSKYKVPANKQGRIGGLDTLPDNAREFKNISDFAKAIAGAVERTDKVPSGFGVSFRKSDAEMILDKARALGVSPSAFIRIVVLYAIKRGLA